MVEKLEKKDLSPDLRQIIDNISNNKSIGIFIGPEGGFDESEIAMAQDMGAKTITLGNRILRTETAGLAVLSMLVYALEDKSC